MCYKMRFYFFFIFLSIFSLNSFSLSQIIPPQLIPWKEWVLKDHQKELCPIDSVSGSNICVWPSHLSISLRDRGGEFSGLWSVDSLENIQLPGKKGQWPLRVTVNGREFPVSDINDRPFLRLEKGSYKISGKFEWDKLPLRLRLPENVGIVSFTLNKKLVPYPKINEQNELWIQNNGEAKFVKGEDHFDLKVFRKLTDSIPMIDETVLKFSVSGKERELIIKNILLKDFRPISFSSLLPLQLSENGELKVQIRTGSWEIRIKSKSSKVISEIPFDSHRESLPKEELWFFQEQHQNRYVKILGANQIDSQLVDLPEGFKGLPTYLLQKDNKFQIEETSRGSSRVDDNELSLDRTAWLDFDGNGFTIKDIIKGTINKNWRLNMVGPYKLGSVKVNGKAQLITHSHDKETNGVEIRNSNLDFISEERLEKNGLVFPSIGWNVDFKKVRGVLNIPPGWKSIALIGADSSYGTWFSQWTLLNLFFVLLIAISVSKLKNIKWGIIVFFGFSFLIHDKGAPYWIWLHLIISWGVIKALKEGKILKFINLYRAAALIFLVWISFPFMISQIQQVIYPSLENRTMNNSKFNIADKVFYKADQLVETLDGEAEMSFPAAKPQRALKKGFSKESFGNNSSFIESYYIPRKESQYEKNALVQTGPGIPSWKWGSINYSWEGPVHKSQSLRLILLSPFVNKLMTFIKVALLLLMIFCFFDISKENLFSPKKWPIFKSLISIIFLFLLITPQFAYANGYPSEDLLNKLKKNLLEKPKCLPYCVSIPMMKISFTKNQMIMRFDLHAQDFISVNIPGSRDQWYPSSVLVDGKISDGISSEFGKLSLKISKGIHSIVMSGVMPETDSVTINLPIIPKNVQYEGTGWKLEGIKSSGEIDKNLQFLRNITDRSKRKEYEQNKLVEFYKLERNFLLGNEWEIQNIVTRLHDENGASVLKISLLEGESVISSNLRVENGFVVVNMPKNVSQMTWVSKINQFKKIELVATSNPKYYETWKVAPSEMWNVQYEGIPLISNKIENNIYGLTWSPWPGEKVILTVTKPEASSGQIITLNKANYYISPGRRLTEHKLNLDFKTSLGLSHSIKLPPDSNLKSVSINGSSQSLSLLNDNLNLPLGVGNQNVEILWSSNEGITSYFKSPKIDLGISGVNLFTNLKLSDRRWIFGLGGPVLGPGILFWGKLIGLLILSFLLSKISWSQLSFLEWGVFSVGLTQGFSAGIFIILGFLLLVSYRGTHNKESKALFYNLNQLLVIFWIPVAIFFLLLTIHSGLLGGPDMGIQGNDSGLYTLNWYLDRFDKIIPEVFIISFPYYIYQIVMLFWSIWAAFSLVKWSRWIWKGIYREGFWKALAKHSDNEK